MKKLAAVLGLLVLGMVGCSAQAAPPAPHTQTPAVTTAPTDTAHKVDPAADAAAAKILQDQTTALRTTFEQGVSVTGTSAQVAWFQANSAVDIQNAIMATFKKADALFTADTEPTDAITAWRDDTSQIAGDMQNWYLSTGDAQTTLKATVEADLSKSAADIALVAKG